MQKNGYISSKSEKNKYSFYLCLFRLTTTKQINKKKIFSKQQAFKRTCGKINNYYYYIYTFVPLLLRIYPCFFLLFFNLRNSLSTSPKFCFLLSENCTENYFTNTQLLVINCLTISIA